MNNVRSILCADGRQINRQTVQVQQFAWNPQSWRIKTDSQKCVRAGLHSYKILKVKLRGYFLWAFHLYQQKTLPVHLRSTLSWGEAWLLIHSQCPLNIFYSVGSFCEGQGTLHWWRRVWGMDERLENRWPDGSSLLAFKKHKSTYFKKKNYI